MTLTDAHARGVCLALVCVNCGKTQAGQLPALIDLYGPTFPLERLPERMQCAACHTTGQFGMATVEIDSDFWKADASVTTRLGLLTTH